MYLFILKATRLEVFGLELEKKRKLMIQGFYFNKKKYWYNY